MKIFCGGITDDPYLQTIYTTKIIYITETTSTKTENKMYTIVDKQREIKVDEFVEFIEQDKYSKVKNNLITAPSNLFYLLQQSETTQVHEKIMRYVIFKLNGIDYGVKDEDLEYLFSESYNTVSSSTILREYIRYWEHSSPPPTNADGTKYIIETDGAGHPTVGYGVDIENCGYKSLFIENGYPTEIGGEVDIEFVDSIEEREIEEAISSIKAKTAGLNLTQYQINALVSRAYNCGVGGAIDTKRGSLNMNFKSSCEQYWDYDRDSKFEDKDNNADFSHELYKQYMKDPVTAQNYGYMPGLERRRKSEWTLFQTGYYDVLNKWHTTGNDIIAVADEIHKYMEANSYTYCVYGSNSYEECGSFGKSHGLNSTFNASKTGCKNTCCATFVSWVLQEAGYIEEKDSTNSATSMQELLLSKGWTKIINTSELEPGDILYYSYGHVEIYAGDGTVYNAGSGNAIRSASPESKDVNSMTFGLRAP